MLCKKKIITVFLIALMATGAAYAEQVTGPVTTDQAYHEDTTIQVTETTPISGENFIYAAGMVDNTATNGLSVDVSDGCTLTIESTLTNNDSGYRAYATCNNGTGELSISGTTVNLNASGISGAQARAVRNSYQGSTSITGDIIKINALAETSQSSCIDSWANGSITIDGSLVAEAKTTNGGRALAVCVDSSEVTFNGSKADISAVTKIGKLNTWTNALVTATGGKVYFNTTETALSAVDESGGYTAQAVSMNNAEDVIEFNGEQTTISARSDYGANGLGFSGIGKMSFNNGNVKITAEIPKGIGTTNAIGILGGAVVVSENVDNFDIVVNGSGIDNGNPGHSNGTAGCSLTDNSKSLTVNAKSFTVTVNGGGESGSVDTYYSDSYGLRVQSGNLTISENTSTTITVNDNAQAALGIYAGDSAKVNIAGSVEISAAGATKNTSLTDAPSAELDSASLAVAADGEATLVLGSDTSAVSVTGDIVADNASVTVSASKATIASTKIKAANNAAMTMNIGPGSTVKTQEITTDGTGAINVNLTGDWTGQESYAVFKSETPITGNVNFNTDNANGLANIQIDKNTGEVTITGEPALVLTPEPTPKPETPSTPVSPQSSGGGCSAGFGTLALLAMIPLVLRKKK